MGILSVFRKASGKQEAADSQKAKAKGSEAKAKKGTILKEAKKSKKGPEVGEGVIIRPTVTEKAFALQATGVYTFVVERNATKIDIRNAVQRQFGVHVERVNVIEVPGKKRQRRRIEGRIPGYRKALVHVRDGESIDITAESR